MRESTSLTVRNSSTTDRLEKFRSRLEESDERLKAALVRFRAAAQAVTPAARISDNPTYWVVGGFALGLFIGWLSRSPKTRRMM